MFKQIFQALGAYCRKKGFINPYIRALAAFALTKTALYYNLCLQIVPLNKGADNSGIYRVASAEAGTSHTNGYSSHYSSFTPSLSLIYIFLSN